MKTELFQAVKDATEGEFELLGELDGDAGWMAYLARDTSGGALSVLVLEEASGAGDGQFELEVVRELDATLAVGRTRCTECGVEADGWPRYCEACGRDLAGVAAGTGGSSAAELLDAVREATAGSHELLGAMRHGEGGGAVYFARALDDGRIVGFTLEREEGDELALVTSWALDEAALAAQGDPAGPFGGEFRVPEELPDPPLDDVADQGSGWGPPEVLSKPSRDPDDTTSRNRQRSRSGADRRLPWLVGGGILGLLAVAALVYLLIGRPPRDAAGGSVARYDGAASAEPALGTSDADPPAPGPPAPPPVVPSTAYRPLPPAPPPAPAFAPPSVASPVIAPPVVPPPQAAPVAPPPRDTVRIAPPSDGETIERAVGQYATAVGSRNMAYLRRVYPGIPDSEARRWERFFAEIGPYVSLRASVTMDDAPAVDGDRSSVPFTLSLNYTDASGRPVRQLLPFRAVLRRVPGGWRLDEVRVIG